ncbi:MAG TPA: amidohydrolase family protein [Jiangellaceae bacterium]
MTRTLIKGGCVLSMNPRVGNHYSADVLIDGETIAEIGQGITARDAEVIDAANTIVMPGFVDTHRRTADSLFRGSGDAASGGDLPYSADDIYAATLIGLLGAAEAGITTVADWAESAAPEHLEAALAAHAESLLRTVFVHAAPANEETADQWQPRLRRLAATAQDPLTGLAAGPAEARPPELDRVARDWSVARELGLRIHTPAGTASASAGAVADLGRRKLLGNDVTLLHCSFLNDGDLDAVAAAGASVSLTPSSEMAAGLPPPPVQKLIDRGIKVGLGVDSERLAPGDLFAQLRSVISVQHATYFDLKLAGKAGLPRLLTTRDVIRYGCIDGATALGLGGVTGSLGPGKQADVIILRTDRPNIFPVNDPIGAVVWGMDTSNIDWVLVAGRPVVRQGELDADLGRIRELALTARARVVAAAGQPAGSSAGESR